MDINDITMNILYGTIIVTQKAMRLMRGWRGGHAGCRLGDVPVATELYYYYEMVRRWPTKVGLGSPELVIASLRSSGPLGLLE